MLSLILATAYFLFIANQRYPLRTWMFPQYVEYWGLTLFFNAACLSAGLLTVREIVPVGLPVRERCVLSMGVGVLLFFIGTFVAGLLHLFGTAFFVLWPLVLASSGVIPFARYIRRLRRASRVAGKHAIHRRTLVESLATSFGTLGLGLIYLGVMTPENAAHDSRWYHLPIAEHYVATHGIEAFHEGWYQGTLPHLASILYTWAMQWPYVQVVDRVLLCSHIEFSLFLWTLVGINAIVRRVAPTGRTRVAWVAVFLFPSILVYDGNLNTSADHVAAFWGPPIFLALLRAWPRLELGPTVLLGALTAGAINTKYQAVSMVVAPTLALVVRSSWLTVVRWSETRARPLADAAAGGLVAVVAWAPHWLKNAVWYHDPVYPLLRSVLLPRPWTPDSEARFQVMSNNLWRPQGTVMDRVLETLKAVWTFSFEPNDWGRTVPVFGSIFTLLLLALPFLRARARLWALFASANVGVFVWYWVTHQDRYLQALLPWFAACSAAAIALAWQNGRLAQIAVCLLVGSQVVWGADAPFNPEHRAIIESHSQLKAAIDRIASNFTHDYARRINAFGDMVDLGNAVPSNAKVLIHHVTLHLGLQRASVTDAPLWQGGISYSRFVSPAALDDELRSLGVTHIAVMKNLNDEDDSVAGDIVFFDYVLHFARGLPSAGRWTLVELSALRPPDRPYGDLLWLGCDPRFEAGTYAIADEGFTPSSLAGAQGLHQPRVALSTDDAGDLDAAAGAVDAVALDLSCHRSVPGRLVAEFVHVTDRGPLQVWIRRTRGD